MSDNLFPSTQQADIARYDASYKLAADIERKREEVRARQSIQKVPYERQRGYRSKYSGRMR